MHPIRTCDIRGCGLLQPGMLAQFAKLEVIDRINVLVLFLKRKLLCLSVLFSLLLRHIPSKYIMR